MCAMLAVDGMTAPFFVRDGGISLTGLMSPRTFDTSVTATSFVFFVIFFFNFLNGEPAVLFRVFGRASRFALSAEGIAGEVRGWLLGDGDDDLVARLDVH